MVQVLCFLCYKMDNGQKSTNTKYEKRSVIICIICIWYFTNYSSCSSIETFVLTLFLSVLFFSHIALAVWVPTSKYCILNVNARSKNTISIHFFEHLISPACWSLHTILVYKIVCDCVIQRRCLIILILYCVIPSI